MPRGGKRPGSGRQPGPLTVGSIAIVEERDLPSTVAAITPHLSRVHEAASFYLSGLSYREIGVEMGVDHDTVGRWLRSHPEILESERRPRRDPAEELAHHVPQAVGAYGDLLQPGIRSDIRLHAADSVMDRVYGKPVTRTEIKAQVESIVVFYDVPDDAS